MRAFLKIGLIIFIVVWLEKPSLLEYVVTPLSATWVRAIWTPVPDILQFLKYLTLHNIVIYTVMFKYGVSDNVKVIQSKTCSSSKNLQHFLCLCFHFSRSAVAQLSQEKRYAYNKLKKLRERNDELEEQCVQHGRLHEIMKQRYESFHSPLLCLVHLFGS